MVDESAARLPAAKAEMVDVPVVEGGPVEKTHVAHHDLALFTQLSSELDRREAVLGEVVVHRIGEHAWARLLDGPVRVFVEKRIAHVDGDTTNHVLQDGMPRARGERPVAE